MTTTYSISPPCVSRDRSCPSASERATHHGANGTVSCEIYDYVMCAAVMGVFAAQESRRSPSYALPQP